ncbi:prephenate/arogenate dehydrogenase [Acaryochloris sp. CCMEE 5410]|uniref:prephenate/arogenate dehydrogenase n=1 Tax=Acaryochloris sp. CCMEE 5410 TaxID=310037 RepID=UPI0002483953|nr:prephenate/arogenate dehydrogenase [Acaryochloris sp. CCMEE 5410]KAI9134681.1 prephenate/arogenate dehydrogenase [Acaryochloris sp. CCMEE 5410]
MNIGIVGLGLIGGSLAYDFRALGYKVLGVSRQPQTCEDAVKLGAVDVASGDLTSLAPVDVVFICTPVSVIDAIAARLIPHLSQNAILTDVGSVKGSVVKRLTPLWPCFIGGHPMAGSEETGIHAAQSRLFAGNPYILTPTAETPADVIETMKELVSQLDCNLHECSPTVHDRAVAWISHLPKMTSAALITACLSEADSEILQLAQSFASSGFRDTSRVGGGNPELGCMMAQYNREELLRSLHQYRHSLDQLTDVIERSDWSALEDLLNQTQAERPKFL